MMTSRGSWSELNIGSPGIAGLFPPDPCPSNRPSMILQT
jgi:hypothetical protein